MQLFLYKFGQAAGGELGRISLVQARSKDHAVEILSRRHKQDKADIADATEVFQRVFALELQLLEYKPQSPPRCNAVKLQVDEEYADSYDLPGRTSKTSVGGGLQYHITSRHFREEAKHWQELGDQTEHNSRVTNSTEADDTAASAAQPANGRAAACTRQPRVGTSARSAPAAATSPGTSSGQVRTRTNASAATNKLAATAGTNTAAVAAGKTAAATAKGIVAASLKPVPAWIQDSNQQQHLTKTPQAAARSSPEKIGVTGFNLLRQQ